MTKCLKHLVATVCLVFIHSEIAAQEYSAGINVLNPNPNAVLHLVSPNGNQGLLIPQLTSVQRDNMILGSDDRGLLIYSVDDGSFYFWAGSNWVALINTDQQSISLSGTNLTISGGNTVDLSSIDTDDQTLSLSGTDLTISGGNTVDIAIADTDDQTLSFSGTDLTISGGNTIDISSIDTDTDDQTLSLSGSDLTISEGNTVDISSIDTDDQTLSLSGTDLTISGGNTVDIAIADTDDQTLSFSGTDLTISGGNTIDISSIDTDTDDQTLSLSGSDLSISEGNTVDLSTIETDPVWVSDRTLLQSAGIINDVGNILDWTQLKNVPSDFSDGVDNEGVSDLTTFDSDDLTEGTTNLYFTDARADGRIGAASVTDLSDVTSAGSGAIITAAERTQLASSITNISGFDSDDLIEGTTNLYFTDARADARIGAASVTDLSDVTSAGSGAIITAAERTQLTNSISNISGFDSDDLTEGTTNLYFTDARADARIGAASVTDLTDVTSAGSGAIITAAERTQLASSITNISGFDSDDLTEGATNLYFTDSRADGRIAAASVTDLSDVTSAGSGAIITAAERTQLASSITNISGFDSDDLTEGTTNLYFTDARADGRIGAASVTDLSDVTSAGSGAIITAAERTQLTNSISNISGFDSDDLTEGTTNLYFTDARADARIGSASVTDLSDVTSAGSGAIITAAERTQLASSITNISGFDSDDLAEGATNLYFTDARADARIGAASVTDLSDVTSAGSGAIITAAERTQLTNSISNISGFDSDDLTEGTTNLYFTDSRADARIGAASVTDLSDVTSAGSGAIITAAERTQLSSSITNISGFDSDDLTEGATNLYFTDSRADARIGAASVTDLSDVTSAGSGAIITAAERTQLSSSITNISGFDSDDLTEGTTNLYFTDSRADARIGAASVTDLSDVTSAGSGAIITAAERTQLASSITNISGFDSDDLIEGATNLYFTDARADARIGAASVTDLSDVTSAGSGAIITAAERTQLTNSISNISGFDSDDLTEGTTNLYFTDSRADARIGAASVTDLSDVTSAGSGAIITAAERTQLSSSITNISGFDSDDLTEGATNLYFTDSRADARIGAASVTDLSDVTSAGSGAIITAAERTQLSSSITNISGFDSDDLTEGTTNLYFTDSRADARIAAASVTDLSDVTSAGSGAIITAAERTQLASSITNISGFDSDDLTEGTTNLYFTDARADARIGAASVTDLSDVTSAGSGAIITAAERTQLTNSISNISGFDSDDLIEGTTNLYFTDARADARIGAASVTDLSDVTSAGSGAIITAAERTQLTNSISNISGFDSDDLTEGTTNLYFTDARADARIGAASVTDLSDVTSAGSGAIITAAERTQLTNSISDIAGFDSDDLTEGGTNLYFTDARADGRIGAASVTDLSDVTSAGSGAIITAAERTQLTNSISDIAGFDSDDLTEGTTNLYFTDARADARIGAASVTDLSDVTSAGSGAIITAAERTQLTNSISDIAGFDSDDLTEGTTNLYFTDARADARVGAASVTDLSDVTSAGSGAIITAAERTQLTNSISDIAGFDSDDLTEGTTNLYFTDARADARIGAASVTDLSDVTSAGSGAIITAAERTTLSSALVSAHIGVSVQAQAAALDDISGLAVTDGNFIVGDGTNFITESGAVVRTSLGLGSVATLDVGTAANEVVQLNASGELPAVDGSQLTNVNPFTTDIFQNTLNFSIGSTSGSFPTVASTTGDFQSSVYVPSGRASMAVVSSSIPNYSFYRTGARGNGQAFGRIYFGSDHGGGSNEVAAAIIARSTENWSGVTNNGSELIFQTTPAGSGTSGAQMTIGGAEVTFNGDIVLDNATATTTLQPSATAARTISFPDASGTAIVSADIPADGEVLTYNGTSGEWETTVPAGGGSYDASNVAITGGTVDGTDIGLTTAAEAKFTNFEATGTVSLPNNSIQTSMIAGSAVTDAKVANNITINGGNINNSPIGQSSASPGKFTILEASGITTTSQSQLNGRTELNNLVNYSVYDVVDDPNLVGSGVTPPASLITLDFAVSVVLSEWFNTSEVGDGAVLTVININSSTAVTFNNLAIPIRHTAGGDYTLIPNATIEMIYVNGAWYIKD